MRKLITFLFLIFLLLSACSSTSSSNQGELNQERDTEVLVKKPLPDDFIPNNLKIVSAGDSLTEGVGDSSKKGGYIPYLKGLLEEEKGIKEAEIINFGVKGNKTPQLLERLKTPEIRAEVKDADIVILTTGGNDVMKVVRENISSLDMTDFVPENAIYKQNLTQVMNVIREENQNSIIVLIGLYNPFTKWFSDIDEMNEIMDSWNDTSKDVVSQYESAYFIEVDDIFKNNEENLLFTDYFHPNDKGYELLANRVFERLMVKPIPDLTKQKFLARKEGN